MDAVRQVATYWGESEAQRQAAFQADAAARAAGGWRVVSQITDWPIGKPGLDLVVTYEHDGAAPSLTATNPAAPANYASEQPVSWQGAAPYAWQESSRPSETGRLTNSGFGQFILARGVNETRLARYLRRTLVFGGLVSWFIVALPTESGGAGSGPPLPGQYPGLAAVCAIEAAITLGLAWYLARWMRLPVAIRVGGIAILAFLLVGIISIGVGYATGQPPSQYR